MDVRLSVPPAVPEGAASHLAVQLSEPESAAEAPFAVLYLHGFASDQTGEKASFFRAQALAEKLAFCSFDFQGHGASGGGMEGLSLTRNLDDVARVHRFLRRRGHRRVALLGSSMGGATALWYAALHPEGIVAGLHIAPAVGLGAALERWAGSEGLEEWRSRGHRRYSSERGDFDLGWGLIEDLRAHRAEELAERHRVPTLVLQGKNDTSVEWREVAEFVVRCACPTIELHLFADGDHRLVDRKERLWALMREFLTGRGLL